MLNTALHYGHDIIKSHSTQKLQKSFWREKKPCNLDEAIKLIEYMKKAFEIFFTNSAL